MTYSDCLDYLYTRLPVFHLTGASAYKPGLENTLRLMEALGNPHLKFRAVHVAGTNGKGSVSHYLAAVLQQSGYSVGLYTSPHLVHFGERIRTNGAMIDEQYVIDFIDRHKALIEQVQPSFFELTMAMAFDYFAYKQVDIAVIEVGLGGRLDSTNIIQPLLSIITSIGFDHMEFLGDTLEKIASEKAGIIKKNVPVVIGETHPLTENVFRNKAREMGASIIFADQQNQVSLERMAPEGMYINHKNTSYLSDLQGIYQLKNLSTVFSAIQSLNDQGLKVKEVDKALSTVCLLTGLRGRWEQLQDMPVIVADTAHNSQGMESVVQQLEYMNYHQLHILIGMVNDKDIRSVLQVLPKHARYYFCRAQQARAMDAEKLMTLAANFQLKGEAFAKISDAVDTARKKQQSDDLLLITGSNFVVGEVLKEYFP